MTIVMGRFVRNSSVQCLLVAAIAVTAAWAQDSPQPQELPNSPSTVAAQNSGTTGQFQGTFAAQGQTQSPVPQRPVGTAAAETPVTTGVAASNLTGAAIAPPKQRRVRTILISVGAIAGAGLAVGTVAALSSASPSRPPNAH